VASLEVRCRRIKGLGDTGACPGDGGGYGGGSEPEAMGGMVFRVLIVVLRWLLKVVLNGIQFCFKFGFKFTSMCFAPCSTMFRSRRCTTFSATFRSTFDAPFPATF